MTHRRLDNFNVLLYIYIYIYSRLSFSGTLKGPRKIVLLSERAYHLSEVFLLKRKFTRLGKFVSLSKCPTYPWSHLSRVYTVYEIFFDI